MASFTFTGSAISGASGVRSIRNAYTSLEKVRSFLALASQNTDNDSNLQDFIRTASRSIDNYTKRFFYPERKTRYYDLPEDPQLLLFDDDLIEVKGLSDINGASEISNESYWARQGDEWGDTPYDRVELNWQSGCTFSFSGTPQRAVHLDGIFGYHEDYDNAWVNSNASLTASVTATTTIMLVGGSLGENGIGYSPRFERDQIWKVDDEFIHFQRGESASRMKVRRGVNGTTAASHASGAAIYTWNVMDDIEYSARELTAFEFMQSKSPQTQRIATPQLGGFSISEPLSWPTGTKKRLDYYIKRRVYSF